jgi:FMN phosphatase YigB (HAD superfamily)
MSAIILFDFGGVVGKDHQDPAEKQLMDIFRVDRETIDSLLSETSPHGSAFRENSITEKQFWDEVYKQSGCLEKPLLEYSDLSMLFAQTYTYNECLLEIIFELRNFNRVGILTNIDHARSAYLINNLNIMKHFDLYYASYSFNSHKRKPGFWMLVNEELSSKFPRKKIVYVDDRIVHVESANQIGWIGIQHIENEDTREKILRVVT